MRPATAPLVLMYHSVDSCAADPLRVTVSPRRFARQMRWLAAQGWRGVSVRELHAAHAAGEARGLVGLTFDDGYADFVSRALPVLLAHGFTATVYVVAGRLGGHNAWDPGGPRKALLDARQVRQVAAAGMEIGSHTLGHVSLPGLDAAALGHELTRSREVLGELIGTQVTGFAYPYGHAGPREVAAVRAAGYSHACAIRPSAPGGWHALPRTYVGERDGPARLLAKHVRHRLRWRGPW
ncbi:peptidoglycan/xylan/chitin deacetylase (PgdA/CDA1 family) [Thermocatellispora tengchongensis]|uniref:Peptidoglycan/xylan/chitin deacetylase (PgdA/CDA1 family) n=2 Tax=Thermocatellispora tengchongensis TaxID=1073253 RepID=A0A840P690_9ACTN|nr:polysaccharide deacetylase family protein [Thermocatellispora tengchongensis]MBB5133371.1 peptidoglycan/xylan/chitin deacetylase (PgdA/CDA1 family) [Thermocatellispora tengchongensis]